MTHTTWYILPFTNSILINHILRTLLLNSRKNYVVYSIKQQVVFFMQNATTLFFNILAEALFRRNANFWRSSIRLFIHVYRSCDSIFYLVLNKFPYYFNSEVFVAVHFLCSIKFKRLSVFLRSWSNLNGCSLILCVRSSHSKYTSCSSKLLTIFF